MRFVAGFIVAIALVAIGGLIYIYSGAFNIAATSPHSAAGAWVLNTTMRNAVQVRANQVSAPASFTEEQIKSGFTAYDQMCVVCHGAPGKDPGEIGKGLRPEPPYLPDVIKEWDTAELFWIVKHGIKMTGMPAFGPTHEDRQLWDVVAFLQKLPDMSDEQYASLARELGKSAGHSH